MKALSRPRIHFTKPHPVNYDVKRWRAADPCRKDGRDTCGALPNAKARGHEPHVIVGLYADVRKHKRSGTRPVVCLLRQPQEGSC